MEWTGLDQRNFPRIEVACDISIREHKNGGIKATTENLGAGGVCVILAKELEKLSEVRLRLTLDQNRSAVECDGRIVWTVRSKDPASQKVTYDTGIEFVNLKEDDRRSILSMTENRS